MPLGQKHGLPLGLKQGGLLPGLGMAIKSCCLVPGGTGGAGISFRGREKAWL